MRMVSQGGRRLGRSFIVLRISSSRINAHHSTVDGPTLSGNLIFVKNQVSNPSQKLQNRTRGWYTPSCGGKEFDPLQIIKLPGCIFFDFSPLIL
jgi:hypothetical protein